ncbi:MAG: cysteine-rich CWC family protein [Pseudomonadota bacterium]
MSVCKRCGATFGCAMVDGNDGGPCWCTALPPVVPLPAATDVTCWCPACLRLHIAEIKPNPVQKPGSDPWV